MKRHRWPVLRRACVLLSFAFLPLLLLTTTGSASNEADPRLVECMPEGMNQRFTDSAPRLRYWRRRGAIGPSILFIHGIAAQASTFAPVIRALPSTVDVLALDQRGHGASERTPSEYTASGYASDVIRIMDLEGITQVILVGHSLGALNAFEVAARYPERVLAVFAEDPPLGLDEEQPDPSARIGLPQFVEFLDELPSGSGRSVAVQRSMAGWPADSGVLGHGRRFDEVYDSCAFHSQSDAIAAVDHGAVRSLLSTRTHSDVSRTLRAVHVPVRLVLGSPVYGGLATQRDEEMAVQLLSNVSTIRLLGMGHVVHSVHPAWFASELQAFAEVVTDVSREHSKRPDGEP